MAKGRKLPQVKQNRKTATVLATESQKADEGAQQGKVPALPKWGVQQVRADLLTSGKTISQSAGSGKGSALVQRKNSLRINKR